ncbi:TauD/TfdA family dioxygenase [Streptomyces sp. NPDC001833]|uniref:TauD/TfdA dioxygenase family protein n=1 Tax=Streptomyces sp. NPDC001833 TaxID=3154658 RepID=UPI0033220158
MMNLDETLKVTPLTAETGALIESIDLNDGLTGAQFEAIHENLLKYKVIFFRGQRNLTNAQQERLAAMFGELFTLPEENTVSTIIHARDRFSENGQKYARNDKRYRNDVWHVDRIYRANFPKIAVLYAAKVPKYGGDTLWANTEHAYRTLPEPLQVLAENLRVRHSDAPYQSAVDGPYIHAAAKHEVIHPMVMVHPETRFKSLLLGNLARRIEGFSERDSLSLLTLFQGHVEAVDHTVRWSWRDGDVAIWDARAAQHYAIDDYGMGQRIMRRTLVCGDVPTGVDGVKSIQLPKPSSQI